MTKKELFEILENCPDDADVYIDTFCPASLQEDNIWGNFTRDPDPRIEWVKDEKTVKRPCKETANSVKSIIL